jgi:hypothetical protein
MVLSAAYLSQEEEPLLIPADVDEGATVDSFGGISFEFSSAAITLIRPAIVLATFLSALAWIESGSETITGFPLSLPSMICGDKGISPRKGMPNFSLIF